MLPPCASASACSPSSRAMGGSETYARELARALAARRRGRRDRVRPVARTRRAATGCRPRSSDEYRAVDDDGRAAARDVRRRALLPAALAPSASRASTSSTTRSPCPCRRSSHAWSLTLHDVQHLDLPELFPRAERLVPEARLRPRRPPGGRRDRAERVRARARDRAARASTRTCPGDPSRRRPRPVPPGGDDDARAVPPLPRRPWPHKNHARLLEAFALLRQDGARAPARPHRRGHRSASPGAPGVEARGVVSHAELASPLPPGRLPRLPEPLRGLRLAAARGDGVRDARGRGTHAGSLPEVCGDAAVLFDPTT